MADILIFDDSVDILEVLQLILQHHGHQCKTTHRKENFMQALPNLKPGLILLDVSLKDGEGREICRELKATEKTKNIPVILMSANPDFLTTVEDCQADGKIEKPFELNTLLSTVAQFV